MARREYMAGQTAHHHPEIASMSQTFYGTIRGKTIELDTDPGFPDGQEVEVFLRPVAPRQNRGAGLQSSAGALADDPESDAILEDIQRARKTARLREIDE